jgi:hypothetical protein
LNKLVMVVVIEVVFPGHLDTASCLAAPPPGTGSPPPLSVPGLKGFGQGERGWRAFVPTHLHVVVREGCCEGGSWCAAGREAQSSL